MGKKKVSFQFPEISKIDGMDVQPLKKAIVSKPIFTPLKNIHINTQQKEYRSDHIHQKYKEDYCFF